jgi:hypothetical protein
MPNYDGHGGATGLEVRLEIREGFVYPESIHGHCRYSYSLSP